MSAGSQLKLNIPKTMLIGLGFLAVSMAWSVYAAYVPLILTDEFKLDSLTVGVIMTIDNIFAVLFQPLFGRLSDKTKTKWGRRMPYVLICAPICAMLFAVIPHMRMIVTFMLTVISFNLLMSAWRSPVVALMPDVTPSPLRSQGNGIINLMGGIGSALAMLLGGVLANIGGMQLPFLCVSAFMIGVVITMFFTVKEPQLVAIAAKHNEELLESEKKEGLVSDAASSSDTPKQKIGGRKLMSLISMLFTVFFCFCGFNVLESYFTLYATRTFPELSAGDASIMLGIFAASFLITAVPAGFIAAKWGRKRCIVCGLIVDIVCFTIMFLTKNLYVLYPLIVIGGLAWSFSNTNTLPMVVDMTDSGSVGRFTGYYYSFSQAASVLSPILFGFLLRITDNNYDIMFLYAGIALTMALISVSFVHHGDVKKTSGKVSASDILSNLDD